jgi:hypothetical protein
MESLMRVLPLVATLAAAAVLASPAVADVSIVKSKSLCRDAAMTQIQPAPTKVRVRDQEVRVIDDTIQHTLSVTMADGARAQATCKVDRETAAVTVTVNQPA